MKEVFISHEVLEPELFFKGEIRDISEKGMCFEADLPFNALENVFIKIPELNNYQKPDNNRFRRAKVKWHKELPNTSLQHSYGVEFNERLALTEDFFPKDIVELPSVFSYISYRIICFFVLSTYGMFTLFFGLEPTSVPLELLIAGFGLLGLSEFVDFVRKDAKARQTRK